MNFNTKEKFDMWFDAMEKVYGGRRRDTTKPLKLEEEILNWHMLNQDVKDVIIGLTEQYGVEEGLRIHSKMNLMDAFEKRKKA
jgi:hypothetical protein